VAKDLVMPAHLGTIEAGKEATRKLLAESERPDAIFATNDPTAMGAVQAIKEAGLRIPDDIAVVGFSNWFFTALLDPPLTSVDQPGFEMGQEAAKLLIRQIEQRTKDRDAEVQPETKVLKTRLLVRESSLKNKKK